MRYSKLKYQNKKCEKKEKWFHKKEHPHTQSFYWYMGYRISNLPTHMDMQEIHIFEYGPEIYPSCDQERSIGTQTYEGESNWELS